MKLESSDIRITSTAELCMLVIVVFGQFENNQLNVRITESNKQFDTISRPTNKTGTLCILCVKFHIMIMDSYEVCIDITIR